MEIKAVKGFGKLGVAVTNIAYPFVDSEIQELRKLMRENLVLVMEKVNFTKEQFYEVSGLLGTISTHGQKKDKPTQHTTGYLDENSCPMFPGMDKVTAKKTDGKYNSVAPGLSKRLKKGFVSKGEPDSPKFHKIKCAQTCGGNGGGA